jgi:exopolysaccharide biosynthesis polyprenyl glycosylphosphotransferase
MLTTKRLPPLPGNGQGYPGFHERQIGAIERKARVQRVISHLIPRELAALGLIDGSSCFAVIYALVSVVLLLRDAPSLLDRLPNTPVGLAAAVTLAAASAGGTIGLYRFDAHLNRKHLPITGWLAAALAFAALLTVGSGPADGRSAWRTLFIAAMLMAWLASVMVIRLICGHVAEPARSARRILLIGDNEPIRALQQRLRLARGRAFLTVVQPHADIDRAPLAADGIWGVVIAGESPPPAAAALLDCKLRGLRVYGAAAFNEMFLGRIDLASVPADTLLTGSGFAASRFGLAVKRGIDVAVAGCMLIAIIPLMALTAAAIAADSPGPVVCSQIRVGRFGKPFKLYKFRSMAADAADNPRWARENAPRITRVGRFIRAARIDALPQLLNVLAGDMSMVGPRPERPHLVEHLSRAIPLYRQRTCVKPGLTRWAQVNVPSGAPIGDAREKLSYDLYYTKNQSLALDAIILLATIRSCCSGTAHADRHPPRDGFLWT